MSKTEVYSWRVSPEMKADIEVAARAEESSVSALLERIVRDWLKRARVHDDDDGQRSLQAAAAECFGQLKGGDALLSEQASLRVHAIIEEQHARHGSD